MVACAAASVVQLAWPVQKIGANFGDMQLTVVFVCRLASVLYIPSMPIQTQDASV